MMKSGAPPDKVGSPAPSVTTISQAELISKSYHYLVPDIISKFIQSLSEKVWIP